MVRKTFSGWERRRETSRRVKLADFFARLFISWAGYGTIIAVSSIFLFLVWVVIPLFIPGSSDFKISHNFLDQVPTIRVDMDEYESLAWRYTDQDKFEVYRLDDGSLLSTYQVGVEGSQITSRSFSADLSSFVVGFSSGEVQSFDISFETSFPENLDPRSMGLGEKKTFEGGVLELTPQGQFRLQKLKIEAQAREQLSDAVAIRLVDKVEQSNSTVYASVDDAGVFRIQRVRSRQNLMTGQVVKTVDGGSLQLNLQSSRGIPDFLELEGRADSVMLVWADGFALRLDTRDRSEPVVAEQLQLLPPASAKLTQVIMLNGDMTLVAGDAVGAVRSWFRYRPGDAPGGQAATTSDLSTLRLGAVFPAPQLESPVSSLGVSKRTRKLAIGYASGQTSLVYVTNERFLDEFKVFDSRVESVSFSPRDDSILLASDREFSVYKADYPHPQTNLSAIFEPVWYEGSPQAEHIWQSSSGSDEFEPKFGMIPLIFGTLKATFYTMLFGIPIALLAAVYTSEFLSKKLRNRIKPLVEMMASLPSVVLGFFAALVIAPFIEQLLPAILASFVSIPLVLIFAAMLTQTLPEVWQRKSEEHRLLLVGVAIILAILLAIPFGSFVEFALFGSDIKAWLSFDHADPNSPFASATGGWMILLVPLSVLLSVFVTLRWVNPWLMRKQTHRSSRGLAWLNLAKFSIGFVLTGLIALALSSALSGVGMDARGSYVDTYVQRNALIVGFVMGFAVIPIIYTIAEDALSSVPEFLRAASLGAGATPWQTAIRIIIPTAMSGLFSAVMVGFGRAVGETMIVLMAAGNTPVTDWNMFNGFRTLSANIAVELPEAVQNSTNYRMLFFAALSLFALTFAINTLAEIIRQRFRKRAYQL